ncbi:chorismate-binding protein, partial [Klebsiella pneumoniae]|nr:chorismate-binding protein [Klebsiella pneumoniae]
LPDAVWLRPSHLREYDHPVLTPAATGALVGPPPDGVPPAYAAAFAQVQEHLRAGNSYEVNLTYRTRTPSTLSPAAAYLRLRS